MKRYPKLTPFYFALVMLMSLTGCIRDKVSRTYTIQSPVFADKSTVIANIRAEAPREINAPGKIYWYGKWIFMSEPGKGIHLIDNSNPASPLRKAFIELPGNLDIAVKGNTLYADLLTDMLAIDISQPMNPVVKKRLAGVFPDRQWVAGYYVDSTKLIVDWVSKDTTVNAEDEPMGIPGFGCVNCFTVAAESKGGISPGQGGSMARFAIVNEYLYSVCNSVLSTHSISNESDPVTVSDKPIGWLIETIYPFRDKLFIGSSLGMYIADISNPASPQLTGIFLHARACDPVVADDKFAYVTLRTGNACMGNLNQLDVLDVGNPASPSLIKSYPMTNPHGLGIRNQFLYLCDGRDGLKVYNTSNKNSIELIQHLELDETFDVIVNNDLLLLVGKGGLYQFRISDNGKLSLLSRINIK